MFLEETLIKFLLTLNLYIHIKLILQKAWIIINFLFYFLIKYLYFILILIQKHKKYSKKQSANSLNNLSFSIL